MLIGKRLDHLVIVICHVTLVNNILLRLTLAITGNEQRCDEGAPLFIVRVDGVVSLPLFVHLESELQVAVGLPVAFASVAKALGHAVLEV